MKKFIPSQIFIEKDALKYKLTHEIIEKFKNNNIPIFEENFKKTFKKLNEQQFFAISKKTLILSVNKNKKLETCKPSADYQFSLVSGCPGICEYCYLQTKHACSPYIKVYVNIDEILDNIQKYIDNNRPKITTFELSSISDPISVEHITGSVKKTIEFFSTQTYGKLRLVTKFTNIDSLLNINHNNNTKIRFSINTDYIINTFEHNTSSLEERIESAYKILSSGYNTGFIIAPIIVYEGWKKDYENLFSYMKRKLEEFKNKEISFELIQFRFTLKSKDIILKRFPKTKLNLNENERLKKWGPYGYYKYVYQKEISNELKKYFYEKIKKYFPNSKIEYFT
ncbi:spore photoproduct lyase [Caloramator fervidus]|uniref:Spore photoproduct lyase n=1 Tax=Caloramator fervidus TaxID=29344 RepID=A0A1H5SPA7_9CLOT|nr:spore photoproduct lyase [Caloramator fervidus]SEF52436.1 spore photoproduct lyase [Caloramator fervidus]